MGYELHAPVGFFAMLKPAQGDSHLISTNFHTGPPYGHHREYCNVATTYSPWPTLDALRPHLEIQTINTGQLRHTLRGLVSDDMECLHAMTNEHGHVVLRSGVEMFTAVYRGQTEEHQPCLPTLARMQHPEDQLLALCRSASFEDAISEHPYVRHCEQARFLDKPLHIDKQGLAQHYGLSTNLLDVTSNFEVASFFATCRWDITSQSFQPIRFSTQPGVLYRLTPFFFVGMKQAAEFCHVGWQPLHRPEQQRAFAMRMQKDHDFAQLPTVQKVSFRQSAKVSVRIWKSFDEGRALFPTDAAAELAEQAKCLMEFTRSQIDQAWIKLDAWNGVASEIENRQTIERSSGLSVVDAPILTWEGLDVERDEDRLRAQLQEILRQVRIRWVCDHFIG